MINMNLKRFINLIFFIIIIIFLMQVTKFLNGEGSPTRENQNNFQVSGWSQDIKLSDPTNDYSCQFPQITASGSYVHIIWQANLNSTGSYKGLCYRRSPNSGNTWEDIVYLTAPNSTASNAIAASGSNVHVIFTSELSESILYRRSIDNGITWEPIRMNLSEHSGITPDINVYGNNIHVVWAYAWENVWGILYLRSLDNGVTWENERWLINGTGRFYHPINSNIAVCKNRIYIIYWSINDTIDLLTSFDNGDTWENKILCYNPSATFPQIAGEDNYIGIVWINESDPNHLQLQFINSEDYGKTWSDPKSINDQVDELSISSRTPSMIIINNEYHLVWTDYRDHRIESDKIYTEVYYKKSTYGGKSWGKDIRLTKKDPFGPSSRDPSIAVVNNSVYILWMDDRDDSSQIYFKRTLPDFTISNLIVPTELWGNKTINFELSLENIGYADGYNIPLTIKDSNQIIYEGIIGEVMMGSIKHLIIPWRPIQSGEYDLEFIIDIDNNLIEWNETNNNLIKTIIVNKNKAPIADFKIDLSKTKTYQNILFDASESYDPDGTIEGYYFDFGDGNNTGWINDSSIVYNYSQAGSYLSFVKVRDDRGAENLNSVEQEIRIKWSPTTPEIRNVIFYPENPVCNENVTISVDAFDLNSDSLEYIYTPESGTIIGTGANITWHAPEIPGKYKITIQVFDGTFYSTNWTIDISVHENHPPEIQDINYISNRIQPSESINISINATDLDGHEIEYHYSSNGGEIIENGSNITWKAPWKDGIYIINIKVTDNRGGFDSRNVFIIVGKPELTNLIRSFKAIPDKIYKDESVKILIELEIDRDYLNFIDQVSADLSYLTDNPSQKLFDTGENGDASKNDGIYSYKFTTKIDNFTGKLQIWANIKTLIPEVEFNTSTTITIENKSEDMTDFSVEICMGAVIILLLIVVVVLILRFKKKK